jgi:hypothetical protein
MLRRSAKSAYAALLRTEPDSAVRKFLLVSMFLLMLLSAAIVVFALAVGRTEIMVLVIVPVLLFIPLLIPYFILAVKVAGKARPLGMADAAARLGFRFQAEASAALKSEASGFKLLAGHGAFSSEIRGERDGVSVCLFEYQGSDLETPSYIVALLAGHKTGLPNFRLVPRTIWHEVRKTFGEQEIELAGSQLLDAFAQQFVVCAPEREREVRELFDESLLRALLAGDAISLEIKDAALMVWREPSVRRDLAQAFRSVQENTAHDAQTLFERAMEIHHQL